MTLFEDGEEVIRERGSRDGKKLRKIKRKGFNTEEVEKEIEPSGRISIVSASRVLRFKTRTFVDGGVIGGEDFVQGVVDKLKGEYLSRDRKSGASKLPMQGKGCVRIWSIRRISES